MRNVVGIGTGEDSLYLSESHAEDKMPHRDTGLVSSTEKALKEEKEIGIEKRNGEGSRSPSVEGKFISRNKMMAMSRSRDSKK